MRDSGSAGDTYRPRASRGGNLIQLFVTGTLILLALLAFLTYQSAIILRRFVPKDNILLNPAENGFKLVFTALCLGLAWLSGLPPRAFGLSYDAPTLARDFLIGLAVGVFAQLIVNIGSEAAVKAFGDNIYNDLVMRNITPREDATTLTWLAVGGAMVIAVLVEELLFRGLLLSGFGWLLGGGVWYIILTFALSILFGSLHLPQGRLGVYGAGLLSVFLSALFLLTGGLLAPIVSHFVINILQVIKAHRERIWEQAEAPSAEYRVPSTELHTAESVNVDAADEAPV